MPKDNSIKSVLIIGSGPIVIGQACEFDYSGSQAARSLREEGIEVILINSNPATIMTDPLNADHVYLKPLEKASIIHILENHKIDAVLPTMGGQTALNLAIDCDAAGIWEKYNVRIIGVDIKAIETTEDREKFRLKMLEIGVGVCKGRTAKSFLEGKEIAQELPATEEFVRADLDTPTTQRPLISVSVAVSKQPLFEKKQRFKQFEFQPKRPSRQAKKSPPSTEFFVFRDGHFKIVSTPSEQQFIQFIK